jgi:hypothetical protein
MRKGCEIHRGCMTNVIITGEIRKREIILKRDERILPEYSKCSGDRHRHEKKNKN